MIAIVCKLIQICEHNAQVRKELTLKPMGKVNPSPKQRPPVTPQNGN